MKILSLYLGAFGKFNDYNLDLDAGFNLIEGVNESGKSTIHDFIEGMLFGFYRRGVKRKLYSEKYHKYKPKNNPAYYGHLVMRYQEKTIRLERHFDKDQADFKIINETTGQDITTSFEKNPIYNEADIAAFIDMPFHLYKNTLSISQKAMQTSAEAEQDLTARLENLSKSGSETFSTKKALQYIDAKKQAIGSSTARTKPYAKALKEKEKLTKELNAALEKHESVLALYQTQESLYQKKNALSQNIEALNNTIAAQENTIKKATYNTIIAKKEAIQTLLEKHSEKNMKLTTQALLKTQATYKSLFDELPKKTTEALRAKDRSDTLAEQRPDQDEMMSLKSYRAIEEDAARLETFEEVIDTDKKAALEAALKAFKSLHKTIQEKQKHQTKIRLFIRLIMIPLMLGVTAYLFFTLSYPMQLLAALPIFILLSLEGTFYLALKNSTKWNQIRTAQVKKVSESLEKERKSQTLAQAEIDKLYQKHGLKDKTEFLNQRYDAKRQKENYQRDQTLIEASLKHQKTYEAILSTYTPLFRRFNLSPSLFHLEVLLDIKHHLNAIEKTLHDGSFEALEMAIDFALKPADISDIKDNQAKRERLEKDIKRLDDKINKTTIQAEEKTKTYRDIALIEADIHHLSERINTLERRYNILENATAKLKKAEDKQEENFAPILSEAIESYLPKLTLNRYHEIKVRRSLEAKIFAKQSHQLENKTFFSEGTLDQIHFAIRLGILKALKKNEGFFILDDAFVNFDQDRLKEALKLLDEIKENHQIILLTCHKREKALLDSLKITYQLQTLPLD